MMSLSCTSRTAATRPSSSATSCFAYKTVGEAIRLANQEGVPVFTADIACLDDNAKVVTHVATDNYSGGKQAAEAIIEALGPSGGKVLILDYQSVESCILRVKGFKEVI